MLLGKQLLSCEEMMSFTNYSQNWPIDTSDYKLISLSSLHLSRTLPFSIYVNTEIELVDIQDFFELAFELVMLHPWLILSKAVILFFAYKVCGMY